MLLGPARLHQSGLAEAGRGSLGLDTPGRDYLQPWPQLHEMFTLFPQTSHTGATIRIIKYRLYCMVFAGLLPTTVLNFNPTNTDTGAGTLTSPAGKDH